MLFITDYTTRQRLMTHGYLVNSCRLWSGQSLYLGMLAQYIIWVKEALGPIKLFSLWAQLCFGPCHWRSKSVFTIATLKI